MELDTFGNGERAVFKRKKEYDMLNKMLDAAISGDFRETIFDESEFSKLQVKLMRYLTTSSMSESKIKEEKGQLKEMITNISHQTKTPLTNIILYGELLEEQTKEDTTRQYASEIIVHAKKLEQLIQALVKMSRLETGIFQFERRKNRLGELMSAVALMGKAKAEEKNIQLVVKECQEESALFDLKWTVEAVYNILDNAIKYSKSGTSIYISAFQYEMFAGVKITDEGPGMEEDEIARVFGRFYRGKEVHDKEGIGVGLYLTREIVEGQGGYIKVSSKPKLGSTFSVFLPR